MFYEFAYDTACLAKEAGLGNLFVTNGYISRDTLATIAPCLDAANIDLKCFTESFYRDVVQARLSEVLDSILEYHKHGIWIELTTLIIPGLNDSESELRGIAEFIKSNQRYGFMIDSNRISNGECPDCGAGVAGIFS